MCTTDNENVGLSPMILLPELEPLDAPDAAKGGEN